MGQGMRGKHACGGGHEGSCTGAKQGWYGGLKPILIFPVTTSRMTLLTKCSELCNVTPHEATRERDVMQDSQREQK